MPRQCSMHRVEDFNDSAPGLTRDRILETGPKKVLGAAAMRAALREDVEFDVVNAEGIPLVGEAMDGNESDKIWNRRAIEELVEQFISASMSQCMWLMALGLFRNQSCSRTRCSAPWECRRPSMLRPHGAFDFLEKRAVERPRMLNTGYRQAAESEPCLPMTTCHDPHDGDRTVTSCH
ncbi:MAG: hypothetical protein VB144_10225 [Clostridia bacterium]|nr:hypothetical protein [Clostridia bacterium]